MMKMHHVRATIAQTVIRLRTPSTRTVSTIPITGRNFYSTSPSAASSSSSSSSSSSTPPSAGFKFGKLLKGVVIGGVISLVGFEMLDYYYQPKSKPANLQPASEKHIKGTRKVEQQDSQAVVSQTNISPSSTTPTSTPASTATPPSAPTSPVSSSSSSSVSMFTSTTTSSSSPSSEVEPSPTHSDHASCRACREGESTNVNAGLVGIVDPTSPSIDDQSTPIIRSAGHGAVVATCPPCYAYSHSLCPLNRAEVGRAGWGYLHTLAAYYPDSPSRQQQVDMAQFINLYMKLYPCGYCADRSVEQLEREPIEKYVHSQAAFAGWMCRAHNEVNERLGKPIFDCKYVDQRWRDGPPTGECD